MVNEATHEDNSTESNHQENSNQDISPSIVSLGPMMSRRIHRRNVLPPLQKDSSIEKLKTNSKRSVHYSASALPRRNLDKPMLVHHKSTKPRKTSSKTQKMSRYGHLESMRNPKPKHLPPTVPVYRTRAKTAIPKAQIAEAAKILSLEDMEEKSY